jgi:hypothetical protein
MIQYSPAVGVFPAGLFSFLNSIMLKPRNSDEAPNWDDDDGYIDLDPVLRRLDIVEDNSNLCQTTPEPIGLDSHETN